MKPEFLIIHHTATSRDRTSFRAVKNYHTKKLGWSDIGYHYFITPKRVYPGRANDKIGAHCRANGMNFKSLGIALTGNFETEEPASGQIESLEKLLDILREEYNIPKENILGHWEVRGAATHCPGKNLFPVIKACRERKEEQKDEIGELKRRSEVLQKIINLLKEEKVI